MFRWAYRVLLVPNNCVPSQCQKKQRSTVAIKSTLVLKRIVAHKKRKGTSMVMSEDGTAVFFPCFERNTYAFFACSGGDITSFIACSGEDPSALF